MSQLLTDNPDIWRLQGELTFKTVSYLLVQVNQQNKLPAVLDLTEVQHTDSAGVAFLLELLRLSGDQQLVFRHVPAQMQSIAQVSGVADLLVERD
jgi:phospholipid transport system transporter-binding protein